MDRIGYEYRRLSHSSSSWFFGCQAELRGMSYDGNMGEGNSIYEAAQQPVLNLCQGIEAVGLDPLATRKGITCCPMFAARD
jgi:hypothetical protein